MRKQDDTSYEELMSEIVNIGNYLLSIEKVQIMNDISDKLLGVGNKVTNCNKLQVEVLKEFLHELKTTLEKEGIELPPEGLEK